MSHSSSILPADSTLLPKNLWWLLPPLILGIAAINGASFWIDEFMTARFVTQPTLISWWHDMRTSTYPETQMPLYLFYLWGWDKLCGHSEWSLRLAALPWFVPGVAAFLYSLRRLGRRGLPVILVTFSSAFLWYYLNEARLYAMQAGVSCFVLAALAECQASRENPDRRWFSAFLIGLLLLSAISIIGMVWASAAVVAAWGMFPAATLKNLAWQCRRVIVVVVGLLGILAVYYLETVSRGAKATLVATTTLQSVAFIFYEQLGFSGLGPGRIELRDQGVRSLVSYWPWLCLYALALAMILLAAIRVVWKSSFRRQAAWIAAGVAIPAAFLLTTGVLKHFRVLGRHFAPLMPVVLLLLGLGVTTLWSRRGWLSRLTVGGFFLLSLFSCLSVRFAARHEKDNYRDAAVFARTALTSGKKVWWNADKSGAGYYQVPTSEQPDVIGEAWWVMNPSREFLSQARVPEVIISSKPDVYDSENAVAEYIARMRFDKVTTLQAFTIWERSVK